MTAVPEGHGAEICRYLSPKLGCLVSVRDDRTLLTLGITDESWKVRGHAKPDVSLDAWRDKYLGIRARLPEWAAECDALPSMDDLKRWTFDSVCETPSGEEVEPDGHTCDGEPSWLLILGLI